MKNNLNRREFIGTTAAAFSIVPAYVRGGRGRIAPSDKINVALIGSGTMGLKMLMSSWLPNEHLQVTCIADPNRDSDDYRDWSPHGMRDQIRKFIEQPNWGSKQGIRAGREAGKEVVEGYYGLMRDTNYTGCRTYNDFRELLDREDDIDAVLVMTPEHLHGAVSMAAMKKGVHSISHKTLANTYQEVHETVKMARDTGLITHLMAWNNDPDFWKLKAWLEAGVIGKVKEVHNWSNRPVWPQGFLDYPEEMKKPRGLDWDLWLGPEKDMPYHLDLTHALFRGWYKFGSGCLGDMGNYSLNRVYRILNPGMPRMIEARTATDAKIEGHQSRWRRPDVSFPKSSMIHFHHAELDVFWYDGGMKPYTPGELYDSNEELGPEGMLFVGEYGKILGDFHGRNFKLLPEKRHDAFEGAIQPEKTEEEILDGTDEWIAAVGEDRQSGGSFQVFEDLAKATCLGAIALRSNGRLHWDEKAMKFKNNDEANAMLQRDYREGWEIS